MCLLTGGHKFKSGSFNATEGKGRRLAYHRAITIVKGGINGLD